MSKFIKELTIGSSVLEEMMNDNLYDLSEEEFVTAGAYCQVYLIPNSYDCDDNTCCARIARYFEENPLPELEGVDRILVEVEV